MGFIFPQREKRADAILVRQSLGDVHELAPTLSRQYFDGNPGDSGVAWVSASAWFAPRTSEREPVFAQYFAENGRAYRARGLSANSPWEHNILFKLRPGVNRNRGEELPVDWANLQRPGFSAGFLAERYERMDLNDACSDWLPTAKVEFDTAEVQTEEFIIHVLPQRPPPRTETRIALFNPKGETGDLLRALGIRFQAVETTADLDAFDVLVVGKGALDLDGPMPDIRRVRTGLRVLVFEQTARVLEQRLGFRVTEYGLRNVFPRIPDHPAFVGRRTGGGR